MAERLARQGRGKTSGVGGRVSASLPLDCRERHINAPRYGIKLAIFVVNQRDTPPYHTSVRYFPTGRRKVYSPTEESFLYSTHIVLLHRLGSPDLR